MRFIFNKMVLLIITISLFFGGWMLLKEESVNESNLPKPDVVTVWSMSSIVRDPNLALNESQNFQVSLLYEPLFLLDAKNKLIPNIAKSYNISKNGTKISITLDETRTFTDGSKITPNDIKRTISRLNILDSKYSKFTRNIKGSGEAKSGLDFFGITTSKNKITFNLITPNPFFLYSLAQPNTGIIPTSALNEKNEIVSDVGSGSYTIKIDAQTTNDATVFIPRDKSLQTFNILVKTQDQINVADAKSNVDIVFGQASTASKFTRINIPILASASWNIYVKNGDSPLADVKFREAILLALNTESYIDAYGSKAIKAINFSGITVDSVLCSPNCKGNVVEAKKMIKKLFPDGNIPNVPIDIEDSELQKVLAASAKKELADVGIPTTISVHEPADWANVIARGEISLFRFGWVSEIPVSSDSLVDNFKASSSDNLSGVDTKLENDIEKYETSTNFDNKLKSSKTLQERIKDLYLSKPIAQYVAGVSVYNRINIPDFDCYGRLNINKISLAKTKN